MVADIAERIRPLVTTDRSTWTTYRFDQLAQNITERVDNPAEAGVERYVGLEHLDPESLQIRRWGLPTDVQATKLRFQPGDIIFGRRRAYQRKLAVADFEGICSAHALVLRTRPDVVEPAFLPFFMQSDLFFERALAISVGSLSPTINWRTLAAQEFALPPMEDQRRIAEVLWAAERYVATLRVVYKDLRVIRTAVQRHFLWRGEHHRVQMSTLLKGITAGRSPQGHSEPADDQSVGVLKVSAVENDRFVPSENKRLTKNQDFRSEFSVENLDLLFTRASGVREFVGRACLVQGNYPNLMLSDKTLRLEIDDGLIDRVLVLEALLSLETRSQIDAVASGQQGGMHNITQEQIGELTVPLPRREDQDRLLRLVQSIRTALIDCEQLITRAQQLRRTTIDTLVSELEQPFEAPVR